jgi:hypothetical protein
MKGARPSSYMTSVVVSLAKTCCVTSYPVGALAGSGELAGSAELGSDSKRA